MVYGAAGFACAVALTGALLLEAGAYSLTAALVFLTIFSWPVTLCWNHIAGWNPQTRRRNYLVYAAVFLAVVCAAYLRSPEKNKPLPLLAAFVLVNAIPTILMFACSAPAVRSIGPCILVVTAVCVTGTWGSVSFVRQNLAGTSFTGAAVFFSGLLSAVVFFAIGWLLLWRVVRNYSLHKASDQSIQLDSMMLLFLLVEGIFVGASSPTASGKGVFLAVLGFPIYWGARRVGLWWLRKNYAASCDQVSLLYLRRFRLGGRTERLFRSVTLLWRVIGDVRLIGGPDLARSIIQPHTLFNFLRRKAGDGLVSSDDALYQQLQWVPSNPDPDMRFRVIDFLCTDDMWKKAVNALIEPQPVVLADFRELKVDNKGAMYEIGQILQCVPLDRVVILTENVETTELVSRLILAFWQSLPEDSPNYRCSRESLNVILQVPPAPETLPVLKVVFSLAGRTGDDRAATHTAS